MKKCTVCDDNKERGGFYAHPKSPDGLMSKCKECHKAYVRHRSRTNPKVQEYDRERYKLPHRKELGTKVSKAWREKNPERYRAQNSVNNAIRDGRLERKSECEECGSDFHVHAHHDDYSKPLDVIWLCALCHQRHHGNERAGPIHI